MTPLLGHDAAVAEWVGRKNGKPFHAPFTAIGVIPAAGGELQGGLVFNGYNGTSIEMSLAGRGVANRDVWRAVLAYVFEQLGCSRLEVHTSSRNTRVKRLIPRLGFTFEGKCRRYYGREGDGLLYSLTVDDLERFKARWRL